MNIAFVNLEVNIKLPYRIGKISLPSNCGVHDPNDETRLILPEPFACASVDVEIAEAKLDYPEKGKVRLSYNFPTTISADRVHFVMIVYQFKKPVDLTKYCKCKFCIDFGNVEQIDLEIKRENEDRNRTPHQMNKSTSGQEQVLDLRDKFESEALKKARQVCFTVKLTNLSVYKGSFTIKELIIRKEK